METPIPGEMEYASLRPQGWFTKFKQWPLSPNSSNMYWKPTQIVRFLFQLTTGVLDPYRSHIQITVQTNDNLLPVGGLVVDQTAQSFVSQMVLSSNARQIERIANYDNLAVYLQDMGFSQYVAQNRQWEGVGFDNTPTPKINPSVSQPVSTWMAMSQGPGGSNISPTSTFQNTLSGVMSPTKVNSALLIANYIGNSQIPLANKQGWPQDTTQCGLNPSHVSLSNWLLNPMYSIANSLFPSLNGPYASGMLMNIRSEYNSPTALSNYIDSTSSSVTTVQQLAQGVIPLTFNTGVTMPAGSTYNTSTPNNLNFVQISMNTPSVGQNKTVVQSIPNSTNLFGYAKPYSSYFSRGCNEPMISPTIPQCQFSYGAITNQPIPVLTKIFKLPLLSGVIGALIPPDQFLLIPLQSLNNLLLEITLNPYAMYSTGYSDVHQFDQTGMSNPIRRNFIITDIQYNLHIYQFSQAQMSQYLKSSLTRQIAISSVSWMESNQYQLPNGQYIKNSWGISTSVQSLAEVVCLFYSNQYLKYPFCRKHFRLSNNITSFQLRFNTDYYPPQPIVGNAGMIQVLDSTGDNSPFLELLLLSHNYLFVTNVPQPRINSYNFAINGRCYNTNNTNTMYDPQILAQSSNSYVWTQNSINADTAMGQSYFNQNRFIGKAAFVYSFQPYAHSRVQTTGINTRGARPFDVIFDSPPINVFPSDQTLYIFTRANIVVIYGNNGVRIMGT